MSDKIRGGLLGMLVGDALGVPYEFHSAEQIPANDLIEMVPPDGFRRSYPSVPPGTWSDDGAQALCLLASLLECGAVDVDDIGRRFVRWHREGYMAVGGRVFDIGIGTASALGRIERGIAPSTAGGEGERDNGNGSLMRVMPLVLWHRGTDAELARDAMLQSLPTHRHPRSLACCALYCVWARGVLEGRDDAWGGAVRFVRELWAGEPELLRELETHIRPLDEWDCGGSGYVVDCLHSARHVVRESSYEAAMKSAIALGRDTDTTACVAGGVAGVLHGESGIPERWLEMLRGREILDPMLDALGAL